MLSSDNFVPIIISPTRIIYHSVALIVIMMIESSNFLNELSDHLSHNTVFLNKCTKSITVRPLVRITSHKNKATFFDITPPLSSGVHGLACRKSAGRHMRHNAVLTFFATSDTGSRL